MPTEPRTFQPPGSGGRAPGKPQRRFDNRESSWARGYDSDWDRLRKRYRDDNPLCEMCLKRGVVRPMHEVDHIVPFKGKDDPLRLDETNLQSLCRPCHATKTAADYRKGVAGDG